MLSSMQSRRINAADSSVNGERGMVNGTERCLFIAPNRPFKPDRLASGGVAVPGVNQCRFPLPEQEDLPTVIILVVLCI